MIFIKNIISFCFYLINILSLISRIEILPLQSLLSTKNFDEKNEVPWKITQFIPFCVYFSSYGWKYHFSIKYIKRNLLPYTVVGRTEVVDPVIYCFSWLSWDMMAFLPYYDCDILWTCVCYYGNNYILKYVLF